MALPFYNDTEMRFDYDPQNNKFRFARRSIGPTAYTDIEEHDTVTPSDTNGIWVSASGNDSNNGTEAAPKKTILASINACTASRLYVWVDDSTAYLEDLSGYDNEFFSGIYATSGNSPSYLSLDATYISDYETIYDADEFLFVSADSGDDDTGDGSELTPYATIAKAVSETGAGKEKICVIDSETYTEPGIEFTGNFQQLWAYPGETPTFDIEINYDLLNTNPSEGVAATEFEAGVTTDISCSALSDNGFFIAYQDDDDGEKGKFVIYNSSGSVLVSSTEFEAGATTYISTGVFSDDKLLIAYRDGADSKGKFVIISSDGSSISYGPTEFETGSTKYISCAVMSDDSFVVSYQDDDDGDAGKFVIYNSSGVEVVAPTEFEAGATTYVSCAVMSDDSFVVAYRDGADSKGKFVIYNSSGVEVVAPTEFEAGATTYVSCAVMSDDSFVVAYRDAGDGNKGKFAIYNSSGVQQVASTEFEAGQSQEFSCSVMSDDSFVIVYRDIDDGGKGKFVIYNSSGTVLASPTELAAGVTNDASCSVMSNDNFVVAFRDFGDGNKGKFVIYYPPAYDMILASTDAVISGFYITQSYDNFCDNLIHGDASTLDISYCDIYNAVNGSGLDAWAIYTDDEITVENCIIHDNDQGIYANNTAEVFYNTEFYWNSEGYALHINGAGAGIEVEHCTFFSNYSGLCLDTNAGTESVKNNIFHENSVYGIIADTAITYTYSVNTDTNSSATAGTSVINANPLFVNEGEVDADDLDLNLKIRVLGYPADSPAYLLADDTSPDRDAGARDTIPIGSETTWTSITVEKPKSGINVTQEPVGAVRLRKKDGTIATHYDAWSEEIDFRFDGLLSEDYESFMDMMTCGSNEVRWYPEPTTNPDDYNTYTLIYDECSGSAKVYKLNRTGIEGFRFKMARAYE